MTETVVIESEDEDQKPKRGLWAELRSLAILLFIVLLVRTFLFQPFTIPSESMEPNLLEGDYIIVSKYTTGYGEHAAWPFKLPLADRIVKRGPERGDVIVFNPEGLNRSFIKRVVALPGDSVEVRNHIVYVNGEQLAMVGEYGSLHTEINDSGRSYAIQHIAGPSGRAIAPDIKISVVPPNRYFVLGDNRDASGDSRVPVNRRYPDKSGAGLVPSTDIIGEAEFVLLSVKEDFSLFKPWTWYRLRGDRWFKRIR